MTAWTPDKIRELGPTCDVPTAYAIVSGGLGRDSAYRAVKSGRFPLPVLHVGPRMRVPTSAILALLGLGDGASVDRSPAADQQAAEPGAQLVQLPARPRA